MVIDCHAHLGDFKFHQYFDKEPKFSDPDEFNDILERYNFDKAIVIPDPWTDYFDIESSDKEAMSVSSKNKPPYAEENNYILEMSNKFEKICPAINISCHRNHTNEEDVKKILEEEEDVSALKFHTTQNHSYIEDLFETGFLDLADRFDLPFIVHLTKYELQGSSSIPSFGKPTALASVAEQCPEVNFIGAHAGRFSRKFLKRTRDLENLHFDVSPPNYLTEDESLWAEDAVEIPDSGVSMVEKMIQGYPDSVLWGSDFPLGKGSSKGVERDFIDYKKLRGDVKKKLEENARKVFKIE